MVEKNLGYWHWFSEGSGGKPGFRRLLNSWAAVHIAIGFLVALLVKLNLTACADTVLLPLAGILVALSFAWVGNAHALMQTPEIEELAKHHRGGFIEYAYVFQTAILAILGALIAWGLAGLSVFDDRWPTTSHPLTYLLVKTSLFALCSLTIRECWHVVLGSQLMLIVRRHVKAEGNDASG
ncbi:MAG TPA: hypothetical protein VFL79_04595 [Terriglobia bacterium]|nr:hypothetical protein [Terriglobia bacterium]